jgi:anti-anti-sigma factor
MTVREKETFVSNLLKIELEEKKDAIKISWSGKSIDREPGKFITPILVNAIRRSSGLNKKIILDFRELAYMNSSSITPVIKILERAKRGRTQIRVVYRKSLKWQDLSFSALEIFKTKDRRVEIKGL